MEDLDLLLSVADNIQGRTICALGDAAAMPVRAFVKNYRDEFEYHIANKQCLVGPGAHKHATHATPLERAQEHEQIAPADVERHPVSIDS